MIPPRALMLLALVMALAGIAITVHTNGKRAGAAKVEQRVERDRTARIAEARADERAANDASSTIATSVAQATVASAAVTHHIVETLRDAIQSVPVAVAGDPLPAAPVERLRDELNAGIARANRAADGAAALP